MFGTTAAVTHRTDDREDDRRRQAGVGHLDSIELLNALMDLPPGPTVPLSLIRSSTLAVLRRAPEGVVRFTSSGVIRLATPPVTPLLAVVHSAQWRDGLERASRFAAYCPRMLVVRELPSNADEALAEASWYGIGVAVGPRSTPTTVLEPEPLADWQPTVAWWRFCERVYRHVVRVRTQG
jgi:hypothetical protein